MQTGIEQQVPPLPALITLMPLSTTEDVPGDMKDLRGVPYVEI